MVKIVLIEMTFNFLYSSLLLKALVKLVKENILKIDGLNGADLKLVWIYLIQR